MKKVVFGLEALSCPSCIKKIETVLGKSAGVDDVKVLFHSNKVRAQFNEEVISAEELKNVIMDLGYPVLSQKES